MINYDDKTKHLYPLACPHCGSNLGVTEEEYKQKTIICPCCGKEISLNNIRKTVMKTCRKEGAFYSTYLEKDKQDQKTLNIGLFIYVIICAIAVIIALCCLC